MQKITTNHEEIIKWAEARRGKPAFVDSPQIDNEKKGIRIDFPGKADEELLSKSRRSRVVSWDKFFEIFDRRKLAFMYDDRPNSDPTVSYKFVNRE